jgi:repressor LexA
MAKQLTKRQHTVLETIRAWIRDRGYSPTIRELGKQLGIKSLRGVTTHLDAIAKKGFLKRESRARTIRLADLVAPFEQAVRIPIIARIRPGEPVLAQEQVEGHVVIDGSWIGRASSEDTAQHFALKVHNDSMITAGILDGDFVIVRQQSAAENGEIVAALLDDKATVKRFFKEEDRTILGKVVAVFRQIV